MRPWTCEEVTDQLEWHASGESAPDEADAINRHLADCPGCQERFDKAARLLALLDWHYRADAGLGRFQDQLRSEQRKGAARPKPLSLMRRLAAVAAVLLATVGLTGWLSPEGAALRDDGGLTVALAPLRKAPSVPGSRNGFESLAPARIVKAAPPALEDRSPREYRRHLKDLAASGRLPRPPAVGLALEVHNGGGRAVYLDVGGAGTALRIDVDGPGVLRLPAPETVSPPFLERRRVRLDPGASFLLPVPTLVGGARDRLRATYWTVPGNYTLRIRYLVGVSEASGTGAAPTSWRVRAFTTDATRVEVPRP